MNLIQKIFQRIFTPLLKPCIEDIVYRKIHVWGSHERLKISKTARLVNTLLNTSSGRIEIGDDTFTGHNVSIITGSHDYNLFLKERMNTFPKEGRDIIIGKGVWIGSNAVILGPCKIGDHAVIGAGAVVVPNTDIQEGGIATGIPAKVVKVITVRT